jgi:hypothetical protein
MGLFDEKNPEVQNLVTLSLRVDNLTISGTASDIEFGFYSKMRRGVSLL